MTSLKKILTNPTFILIIILLIGLFFRIYNLGELYPFAHDQDLYSWIVKDMLVDHKIRLIGQVTSIEGIFIGPLFYYLLIPFFAIFKLDPIGATVPAVIIGLLTIYSIYFVFSRFFGKTVGLIGAFIYSVSFGTVMFDRWVVPTQPTMLWSIWYLFVVFSLAKGNFKVLPILGILAGLVWHIHIGLIPPLIVAPIALILSGRKIKLTQVIVPLLLFLGLMLPFFIFEARHDFLQVHAALSLFGLDSEQTDKLFRLGKIINSTAMVMIKFFVNMFDINIKLGLAILTLFFIFISFKKLLSKKYLILIITWFLSVALAQLFSKKGISEYYFANLAIFSVLIFSLTMSSFFYKPFTKVLCLIFLTVIFFLNLNNFLQIPVSGTNYLNKKTAVQLISADAKKHNYPCVSINYITDLGNNVGFRYLFWFNNLHIINPGKEAPIYNIVMPWNYAYKEVNMVTGRIGIILPKQKKFTDEKVCNDPKNQLLPLLGFNN